MMQSFGRKASLVLVMEFSLVFLSAGPQSASAQQTSAPPANPDFTTERQLLQKGRYDEAVAELQAIASRHPETKGIDRELGIAYYRKGDYIQAAHFLEQSLQTDPRDNEATQLLGLSDYLGGKPSEAIPLLEKVQTWYPQANVDAAYILGQCFIQTKDYPHARGAFAKMFALPPDSAGSYLLTARMLSRQEFEPVALDYAQKAVSLDPKLPLARIATLEMTKLQNASSSSQASYRIRQSDDLEHSHDRGN